MSHFSIVIVIDHTCSGQYKLSQEKKLKNWYIQEYTTETTFESNISKKVTTTMVEKVDMMNKQATVNTYYRMNIRNERWMMRLKVVPLA